METVTRTERGWTGHFYAARFCMFRRNTLFHRVSDDYRVVVSTVGNYLPSYSESIQELGSRRYYERMAFLSSSEDTKYWDANVQKEVFFDSDWSLGKIDDDNLVDQMHEEVVKEFWHKLESNTPLSVRKDTYKKD
jgi:hypothetical protein